MSKKTAAGIAATVLLAIVGVLQKCEDETPILPGAPPAAAAESPDAGAP